MRVEQVIFFLFAYIMLTIVLSKYHNTFTINQLGGNAVELQKMIMCFMFALTFSIGIDSNAMNNRLGRSYDGFVSSKHHWCHFNGARFQTECSIWIAWLQFQFEQHPNVIRQLERLIQHILSFNVSLGDCENVVCRHLSRHTIRCAAHTAQTVLHFICCWDLFPCGQEQTLVKLSVLLEQ